MPRRWRVAADVLLVGMTGATALLVVRFDALGPRARLVAVLVAFTTFAALFLPSVRHRALTPRRIVTVSTVLVTLALVAPPGGSHDLWSYAVYGRLVSVHHVSAYADLPAAFPRDPFFHLVARGWRHTASVYGPAFVALSAVGTRLTGSSVVATRLFFQGVEALALAGAVGIVWRRTRDPVALAFVALNPALILVVNGGHNDVLVGLALLAGTLLLADGRPGLAGLVLAAGALVKLVLLLPFGALLLWMWRRGDRRATLVAGVTTGSTVLAGYVVSGGRAALAPLFHAGAQHSRSSLWELATQWLAPHFAAPRATLFRVEGDLAVLLVGTVALLIALAESRSERARVPPDPHTGPIVAGAAALVFLIAGAFVLPWYSAWSMPLVALVWRSRVAALAVGQAALVSIAFAAPVILGPIFQAYALDFVPLVLFLALAYLAWSAARGRLRLPVGRSVPRPHRPDPATHTRMRVT